jgi:hypothetical protein
VTSESTFYSDKGDVFSISAADNKSEKEFFY